MPKMNCIICETSLVVGNAGIPECPECGVLYQTENSTIRQEPIKQSKQSPLVRRARMMCEDGEFGKAKETIEKALDENPENAEAYLTALMIDMHCRKEDELDGLWAPTLPANKNFEKAKKFGNKSLKSKLAEYEACALEPISERVRFTITDTAAIHLACEKLRLMTAIRVIAEKRCGKDLLEINPFMSKDRDALDDYKNALEDEEEQCRKKLEDIALGRTEAIEESLQDSIRPITWRVLTINEDEKRALVIADESITEAPFHLLPDSVAWKPIYKTWRKAETYEALWENCSLRKWLNEDFFDSLPMELRNLVIQTRIDNPGNGTMPARGATRDKVFLLSADEAMDLFPSDSSRKSNGVWWLRTQGQKVYDDEPTATVVSWGGSIEYDGRSVSPSRFGFTSVFDHAEGIRPAMWIRIR